MSKQRDYQPDNSLVHDASLFDRNSILHDVKVDPATRALATRYIARRAPELRDMIFGVAA